LFRDNEHDAVSIALAALDGTGVIRSRVAVPGSAYGGRDAGFAIRAQAPGVVADLPRLATALTGK
jgi:hypothetical protein